MNVHENEKMLIKKKKTGKQQLHNYYNLKLKYYCK